MASRSAKRNLFKEVSEGMASLADVRKRKCRIREHALYHYTEGGFPHVWLKSGYVYRTTPYGRGISIQDVIGLHKAIRRATKAGKSRARLVFEHDRTWKEAV
jgi:hypothetical protein